MSTYLPCRCSTLEISEGLCQLQRLHHNSLLFLIVSDFGVSCQREILSQRMPIKAVVGHNSSKIWVANKENPEHIIDFPLVPVRPVIQICNTWDRRCLVCVGLDADSGVVADAQEIVNDLKSLVSSREVNSGDIRNLGELGCSIVCKILATKTSVRNFRQGIHLRNEKTGVTPAGEM